jgi:hypothetical protein
MMPATADPEIRITNPALARFVTALFEAAGVAHPLASRETSPTPERSATLRCKPRTRGWPGS